MPVLYRVEEQQHGQQQPGRGIARANHGDPKSQEDAKHWEHDAQRDDQDHSDGTEVVTVRL